MTDEELIARLRGKNCCESPSCNCDAAADRIAALTEKVERLTGAVWLKVGECLAGMTHAEVSPAARRMIEKAIRAALSATEEGHE